MAESVQAIPQFIERHAPSVHRQVARPTAREWWRHTALFLLTALTATIAGIMLVAVPTPPEPDIASPVTWLDYVLYLPMYYVQAIGILIAYSMAHPVLLAQGVIFAGALLTILLAHEAGHYIACRLYGVNATLPFFIPAPPLFLAGTFGAFIKIKSPIPSRRALFDIGIAGPLAGFAVTIPVAIAGLLIAHPQPPLPAAGAGTVTVIFNDPLFLRAIAWMLDINLNGIAPNPLYFAAWIGLLVTSLNLLPVGQLDGGHVTYAIFGTRAHRLVGRLAFLVILTLAPLGWIWHGVPSGFVYSLLLLIMLRVRHPQAEDETDPMGRARTLVAILALLVFILSFLPFPITII